MDDADIESAVACGLAAPWPAAARTRVRTLSRLERGSECERLLGPRPQVSLPGRHQRGPSRRLGPKLRDLVPRKGKQRCDLRVFELRVGEVGEDEPLQLRESCSVALAARCSCFATVPR